MHGVSLLDENHYYHRRPSPGGGDDLVCLMSYRNFMDVVSHLVKTLGFCAAICI